MWTIQITAYAFRKNAWGASILCKPRYFKTYQQTQTVERNKYFEFWNSKNWTHSRKVPKNSIKDWILVPCACQTGWKEKSLSFACLLHLQTAGFIKKLLYSFRSLATSQNRTVIYCLSSSAETELRLVALKITLGYMQAKHQKCGKQKWKNCWFLLSSV